MITRTCSNLNAEIDSLTVQGYRLDMIMPADDPRAAILSKGDDYIRLSGSEDPQSKGRAGMEYRDLIPDRLGGKVIASHIRLTEGGEVPDYVHYHKLRFQVIYCKSGWVRVVYEDQGPPFVMNAGDCVLQPPEIRHRVLESSAGAEVIEVSSPAVHETWVEHDLELPTAELKSDRVFGGQRFVLHRADATAGFAANGCVIVETAIEEATHGYGRARIVGLNAGSAYEPEYRGEFLLLYVLRGSLQRQGSATTLHADEHLVIRSPSEGSTLMASDDAELLEIGIRQI